MEPCGRGAGHGLSAQDQAEGGCEDCEIDSKQQYRREDIEVAREEEDTGEESFQEVASTDGREIGLDDLRALVSLLTHGKVVLHTFW